MATITVTRTGSSAGEVMVDHATSDGTATSGDDYVAASGTISFADGDTGDKTFDVFIIDDGIFEGDETVNLTLSDRHRCPWQPQYGSAGSYQRRYW